MIDFRRDLNRDKIDQLSICVRNAILTLGNSSPHYLELVKLDEYLTSIKVPSLFFFAAKQVTTLLNNNQSGLTESLSKLPTDIVDKLEQVKSMRL